MSIAAVAGVTGTVPALPSLPTQATTPSSGNGFGTVLSGVDQLQQMQSTADGLAVQAVTGQLDAPSVVIGRYSLTWKLHGLVVVHEDAEDPEVTGFPL